MTGNASPKIAEMHTGEGKTLSAAAAVAWLARAGNGVHVMTVNDYLARRDAKWMKPIYAFFGLSVGCIQQNMDCRQRKQAYACDITYATANEIGFDFLRDQTALCPKDQVHRPFAAAVVDEADSILIDEARIPLVLAGGQPTEATLADRRTGKRKGKDRCHSRGITRAYCSNRRCRQGRRVEGSSGQQLLQGITCSQGSGSKRDDGSDSRGQPANG